jgi:hypothetical protein
MPIAKGNINRSRGLCCRNCKPKALAWYFWPNGTQKLEFYRPSSSLYMYLIAGL